MILPPMAVGNFQRRMAALAANDPSFSFSHNVSGRSKYNYCLLRGDGLIVRFRAYKIKILLAACRYVNEMADLEDVSFFEVEL